MPSSSKVRRATYNRRSSTSELMCRFCLYVVELFVGSQISELMRGGKRVRIRIGMGVDWGMRGAILRDWPTADDRVDGPEDWETCCNKVRHSFNSGTVQRNVLETIARLTSAVAQMIIGATCHGISTLVASYPIESTMTMMLATQTKTPKPNMAMMPRRCESGSCNLRTSMMGRARMMMSITRWTKTVPKKNLESSISQWPRIDGRQNFATGTQWKIARKVCVWLSTNCTDAQTDGSTYPDNRPDQGASDKGLYRPLQIRGFEHAPVEPKDGQLRRSE